jgi:hypothetical protein
LRAIALAAGSASRAWTLWERWSSEIIADLWAVSRLGIAAPLGLLAVIGLPRVFVFRLNVDDPHPMPWVRLHLACAFGNALHPDPQWGALSRLWAELYPPTALSQELEETLRLLERTLPAFVQVTLEHRAAVLNGRTLGAVLRHPGLEPGALRSRPHTLEVLETLRPCIALAHLGQARNDGALAAEDEATLLERLLTRWALTDAVRLRGAANVVELKAGAHARPRTQDLSQHSKEAAHG